MAAELPISAKDLWRFAPSRASSTGENGPVYLIAVPTPSDIARWRRDLARTGARYVDASELRETLEDAVKALLKGESRERALEDIAFISEAAGRASPPATTENGKKSEKELAEEQERLAKERTEALELAAALVRNVEVEVLARRDWPPYAELCADRDFYVDMARILAARHFVRGWENVEVRFEARNGLVTEEAIGAIPRPDLYEAGLEAMGLMHLGAGRRKN